MARPIGTAVYEVDVDTSKMRRGFDDALLSATKLGRTLKGGALAAGVGAAATAVAGLTRAVVAFGAESARVAADVDRSFGKIAGITNVPREEIEKFLPAMRKLAQETGKDIRQIADAFFFVNSAGIKGAEGFDVLTQAARLSAIGLGDMNTLASTLAASINAYGAENLTAAKAADVLVATIEKGIIVSEDLAGAFGANFPLAVQLGISIDELGASFASLTRSGTDAHLAATQLRGIMRVLVRPTQQARAALKEFNLDIDQIRMSVGEHGLLPTLQALREHFIETTGSVGGANQAMGELFPEVRGLIGIFDLLGPALEENRKILEYLTTTTGNTDKAFKEWGDTVVAQRDRVTSALSTIHQSFGDTFSEGLRDLLAAIADSMGKLSEKINDIDPATLESINAGLRGFGAAIGTIIENMPAIITWMNRLSYVMAPIPRILFDVLKAANMSDYGKLLEAQENLQSIQQEILRTEAQLAGRTGRNRRATELRLERLQRDEAAEQVNIQRLNARLYGIGDLPPGALPRETTPAPTPTPTPKSDDTPTPVVIVGTKVDPHDQYYADFAKQQREQWYRGSEGAGAPAVSGGRIDAQSYSQRIAIERLRQASPQMFGMGGLTFEQAWRAAFEPLIKGQHKALSEIEDSSRNFYQGYASALKGGLDAAYMEVEGAPTGATLGQRRYTASFRSYLNRLEREGLRSAAPETFGQIGGGRTEEENWRAAFAPITKGIDEALLDIEDSAENFYRGYKKTIKGGLDAAYMEIEGPGMVGDTLARRDYARRVGNYARRLAAERRRQTIAGGTASMLGAFGSGMSYADYAAAAAGGPASWWRGDIEGGGMVGSTFAQRNRALYERERLVALYGGTGRPTSSEDQEVREAYQKAIAAQKLEEQQQIVSDVLSGISGSINDFVNAITQSKDSATAALRIIGSLISHAVRFFTSPTGLSVLGFKADGGYASGLTMVGEAGPELVDFNRPGQVYSNEQLAMAMGRGGGGESYTINVNADNPAANRQAVIEGIAVARELAVGDVAENLSRPSEIRSSAYG